VHQADGYSSGEDRSVKDYMGLDNHKAGSTTRERN
jgi:hypothetical protein